MSETAKAAQICELLGVRVHTTTIPELNRVIERAIDSNGRCILGCHNLHSVYLFQRDKSMREFYEVADFIAMDGMMLVVVARLLGYKANRENRVTWMDWLDPLMALAVKRNWRVYYLGSEPGVADKAAGILMTQLPGLRIRTHHGYFDASPGSADTKRIREEINAWKPHLLMVGMGQPRQEKWVIGNADLVEANAIVTPGACFDYVAGIIPRPWRFLGPLGLEWLFRLATEPRRLGRRYLIEPWWLAGPLLRDLARRARRERNAG